MLIFPNLADDRGDRVTAIVRSGWGHATGCMVSQSVQIWRNGRQKKLESFVLHIRTFMSRESPARRTLQRSASGACGEGISGVPFPRCPHPTLKSTTVTAEGPPGCGTGTWSSVKVWRVSTLEPRALAASLGSPALIPPVAGVINLPRKSCAARRPLGRGPAGRVDHCTTVPPRRPPGSVTHVKHWCDIPFLAGASHQPANPPGPPRGTG